MADIASPVSVGATLFKHVIDRGGGRSETVIITVTTADDPDISTYIYTRTTMNPHSPRTSKRTNKYVIEMSGPSCLTSERQLLDLFSQNPRVVRNKLLSL